MNVVNQKDHAAWECKLRSGGVCCFCTSVYFFVTFPEELDTPRRNSQNAPGVV